MTIQTEPIELVDKNDPTRVIAYACPKCGVVVDKTYDSHTDVERYRKLAARHCAPHCTKCDVLLDWVSKTGNYPGYGQLCVACAKQHDIDIDRAQYDKAEHLTEQEWSNDPKLSSVIYCENYDRYFNEGLEEFREWWLDHHYDPKHPDGLKQELPDFPEYVWTVDETVGVKLDAESILERALEEYHEDAIEGVEVDELQRRLDEWSELPGNQVRSWMQNCKRLVMLDEDENERFKAEWLKDIP